MWFLPSVGISIFVEFLLIPKQSSLCWMRRSSFVKPIYIGNGHKSMFYIYVCFDHKVICLSF